MYTFTPDYLKYDKKSEVQASNIAMTNIQTENILTYNLALPSEHKLELMAGMTYNYDLLQNLSGTARVVLPTLLSMLVRDGLHSLMMVEQ